MKLKEGYSKLSIVTQYQVEVRFTQPGLRVATWLAVGMPRLHFQMWDSESDAERASSIDKLVKLPANTSIEVAGYPKSYTVRIGEELRKVHTFNVTSWKIN